MNSHCFVRENDEYAPWVAEHGLAAPYGECQCGCGEKTNLADGTDKSKGWRKNHPIRFVAGHQTRKYQAAADVFWANVSAGEPDECWEWTGGCKAGNYGLIHHSSGNITAHRFSYQFHLGAIPRNMIVRHRCDNPLCVNPSHLEVGTPKDNTQDAIERKRFWDETGSHRCAKLKAGDIPTIRRLAKEGMLYKDIAHLFSVDPSNIGQIIRGKTWIHV